MTGINLNSLLHREQAEKRKAQADSTTEPTPAPAEDLGPRRAADIERATSQDSFVENVQTGFGNTALSAVKRLSKQEGDALSAERAADPEDEFLGNQAQIIKNVIDYTAPLFGIRAGEEKDYSAHYEELTTGIPSQFHDEILDEPNLEAAERARDRVSADLARAHLSAQQQGLTPALAQIAGSIVDLDAPLIAVTGGGYKAARIAQLAASTARLARLSGKNVDRIANVAVGANAGFQSGVIIGTGEAVYRETADWTTVAESALQAMILGGAISPILGGSQGLVKNAQDDLHARVARDDISLRDDTAPEASSAERLAPEDNLPTQDAPEAPDAPTEAPEATTARKPRAFKLEEPETGVSDIAGDTTPTTPIGAPVGSTNPVQAGPAPRPQILPEATHTPIEDVSEAVQDIGIMADNWRTTSDWQSNKVAADKEFWTKVATSTPFTYNTSNWRKLYTSDSSTMNFMLGNVFESPNGLGRGRWTSAAGMEIYHRQISQKYIQPLSEAGKDWARRNGKRGIPGITTETQLKDFNRGVMLEMNDRLLGRKSTNVDPAIIKAADALDEAGDVAINIGKGREGQLPVDGFENLQPRKGYSPYTWKGNAVRDLESSGVVTRQNLITAMSKAYRAAGIASTKDAEAIAKAVVERASASADSVDTNITSLLNGDGREWLNTALEGTGMTPSAREGLMRRLTGIVEERSKEGFAKSRNDIDLNQMIETSDGSDVRIVDLMDTNLHQTWQSYTRRLSGAAALARVGITNKAKREQFIQAAQAQQRALGEEVVEANLLRSMLSNFDGGPIKGFSPKLSGGNLEDGIAPAAVLARRATNLSLLGKLGLAQLAETGAGIAQNGLANWWRRGPGGLLNKEIREGNKVLLDDLAFVTGNLGDDHKLFAQHLDLDEKSTSRQNQFFEGAQAISSQASAIQAYASGFNHTRKFQQRISAGAVTDKVFRNLKDAVDTGKPLSEKFVRRSREDLGLSSDDLNKLTDLVKDGTIEFAPGGHVNRVNVDKWDQELADVYGASVIRNMNQVVQKAMAGEEDTWMSTTVGSILTHLVTFPLLAMQKAFIRNMRHSDMDTLSLALAGMATASLSIAIRDAISGKEAKSPGELAKAAFGYSNLTGWIPMHVDPALTILGLEDLRFNQFGRHSELAPPVFDFINRSIRLPGAIADTVTGDADYYDRDSLKALPFANTYFLSQMLK